LTSLLYALARSAPLLASVVAFLAFAAAPARGQGPFSGPAMTGPILATVPAQANSVLLYDLGTDTRRELSFGALTHTFWGFSPDGCRLLVTLSDGAEPARMISASLDGEDVRELVDYTEIPDSGWGVWEPQWSPDGTKIAFTMVRATRYLNVPARQAEDEPYEYRIAWIPAQGGTPTFYSVAGDEHTPQWSPDGAWLAYVGYEKRIAGADPTSTAEPTPQPPPGVTPPAMPTVREADLWVVSADAAEKYRLTFFTTGSVGMPRWSPDGNLIAFVYSPVGNNDQFWMVGNQPGAIPTQLSFQWSLILDLTWLPDSSAMLAAVRDFGGPSPNRLLTIPLVGLADSGARPYVDDPALTYADFPRFSPDGRWLALRSEYSLALLDTGTNDWFLLDVAPGNTPPYWSPAGFEGEHRCS